MKAPAVDPKFLMYAAVGLAVLYVTYKATKAVGSAVDSVTAMPGKALDGLGSLASGAYHSVEEAAANAWHSATDLFTGSSVKAGTTSTPRTLDPTNASFTELSSNSIDLFDLRYYGYQGNVILPAATNQSGPGGGGLAVGPSGNSSTFFTSSQPLTSGM